jgi:glycosyltransferase involved in cell wall biosynthesis
MHIAIDARIINSSTGRYVERLLHYLQNIDDTHNYTVLVRAKDTDYWKPTNPKFSVKVADYDNYSFDEQIGFKRFLDELQADLVHFCMPQQPVLYGGKKVTTFHDLTLLNTYNSDKNWLVFKTKQLIGRFVFKAVAKQSTHIITPTEYTKLAVMKFTGVQSGKIVVTYEAAETETSNPTPYALPFKQFILYVGQQPDYKNIRRLGDAHLVLVGKKADDTKSNEAYFDKNNYKNIHFTGFISDEQRDWLMQQCTAYVFPSLMEGFGLPGLEAMAAGAPVISSNATCLPEVYGDAAVYFNPHNTDDIATAIERVISDENLRQRLIEAGSEQVRMYSWQRMAEQTHAVYMASLNQMSK